MTLSLQGASTTDATPFVDINVFHSDFRFTLAGKFYKLNADDFVSFSKMNHLQKSQIQDIINIKLPRNLKFTDRLSMTNHIETRIPFLDVDIAKFVLIWIMNLN